MGVFAEQLTEARKAAHLTQDQLAEKVHVTRAAVSHWENGRYIPDFDMIHELSKALDYQFDVNGQNPETPEEPGIASDEAVIAADEAGNETEAAAEASPARKKWLPWVIGAVVLITAVILLFIVILPGGQPAGVVSDVDPAVRYSIADYQAVTPREGGKAYLVINTESRIEHGENKDFWLFAFRLHEDQGIAIHLDEAEQVNFSKDHAHPMHFTDQDMTAGQLNPDIPANQSLTFDGGMPMDQKNMIGVGLKVIGTDENGNKLTFTAYIPFPEQ